MRARFLPKYVTSFPDRHGKDRLRFRRKGFADHYFKAPLGTEDFRKEYHRCLHPAQAEGEDPPIQAAPGSIAYLAALYMAVPERLGPTETTQTKVRGVIDRFRAEYGDLPIRSLQFDHVDGIIAKKRKKVQVDGKWQGGIEAARKLRKELVRMFDFAVKKELCKSNPAFQADRVKVAPGERSQGFRTWTEEDIAQYRERHALGTKPRLAMELILWTDQRRVDSIHLGKQHVRQGRLHLTQTKTGKNMKITIAPQLMRAIVAMPPGATGDLCYLVTSHGKPFTNKGFGNWFKDQCVAAGLLNCTAHGLRKATMRRMAELNMGNQTMKAMSGHTNDDEVAKYTAEANQMRMADGAVAAISTWEMSNLPPRLDTDTAKTA